MADEPAPGSTSTPPAAPAAEPAVAPAPVAEPKAADSPAQAAEPAKSDAPAPEPAKEPEKEPPLFTLPEDFKAPEGSVSKFETTLKGKLKDGKLEIKPQDIADLYVGLARDANTAWQKQIEALDKSNSEACKARFSPEELAAAETSVGFFSSYDPAFRELAKRQLNDPTFVNAMRLVGELLSEDEIGRPTPPPKPADNRSLRERAQEGLYGRKPS